MIEPVDRPAGAESWIARHGWVLAATWLVFLLFPWLSIVGSDDQSATVKTASTALMVVFGLVYVDGFRRLHRHEQAAELPWPLVAERTYTGRIHIGVLVAIGAILFAIAGPAGLGVMTFLVAFSVFHFSWPVAWAAIVVGTGGMLLLTLVTDTLDDLWVAVLIVAAIGVAAILIRGIESTQAHQSALRTQLALSDERNRVARDVHDVLGHSLTAVILKAELCDKLLDSVDPTDERQRTAVAASRDQLAELQTISRGALAEIRSTVGGLRAADLADEVTVARTVLADAGVGLLVTGEIADVPEQHRSLLAWVVRESVTNIVRHSGASQCHVELSSAPVALRVSDDGIGFDQSQRAMGNGLRGVRERIEAAGGELVIRSDAGTAVEVAFR